MMTKVAYLMGMSDEQPFDGFVTFDIEGDDTQDWNAQFVMGRDDWEDMGGPDEVTLTVQPGHQALLDMADDADETVEDMVLIEVGETD